MSKIIKVCFVIPKMYVYLNTEIKGVTYGGAERQGSYLARNLARNPNFEVHACVADFGQNKCEYFDEITVHKSFRFEELKILGVFKLYQTLKKIDANIYIFRSADIGVALGVFFVKLLGRKTLYMVANNDESSPSKLARWAGKISALSMGKVYQNTDFLTVQSDIQKKSFQKFRNIQPHRIIRNIYKITISKSSIDLNAKKYILWVGRCHPWKQPDYFLELARQNPNEKFIMISPKTEDENYFQNIKKQADSINNLEFIDFVAPDRIKMYYQKAKIYVITSISEGFPNTMMEAMEACCPIVSLNINPDGILDTHQMGLMSKEIDSFYKNFITLLKDTNKRIAFGENARKYLENYHQEDQIIHEFTTLLQQNIN